MLITLFRLPGIAENIGFEVVEIRKARYLNPGPQQKEKIGKLLEGVIAGEIILRNLTNTLKKRLKIDNCRFV